MKRDFFDAAFQVPDSEGRPLSGGLLYFYRVGTSELKDTWSDSDLTVVNANPVVLNARGRPESGGIFLNGDYKVVLHDEDGVIQWSRPSVNPVTATVGGGGGNDGGWNFDDVTDGEPSGLAITQFAGASHAIVDDESYFGAQSLRVTSTGNGGAVIEPLSFQPIMPGRRIDFESAQRASVAGARCVMVVEFYDLNQQPLTSVTVLDNADIPLAWTLLDGFIQPPLAARFLKWKYTAIDPTSGTLANTVWLGRVKVGSEPVSAAIWGDVMALERRTYSGNAARFEGSTLAAGAIGANMARFRQSPIPPGKALYIRRISFAFGLGNGDPRFRISLVNTSSGASLGNIYISPGGRGLDADVNFLLSGELDNPEFAAINLSVTVFNEHGTDSHTFTGWEAFTFETELRDV